MPCYLFELDNIVKEENGEWFERDRKHHIWVPAEFWSDLFREELLEAIAVQYDESTEKITSRRPLPGRSLNEELMAFEDGKTRLLFERSEKHYYLFEYGCIVRNDGLYWCQRDRKRHKWIYEQSWMDTFYDVAYSVIEIRYDEETETITDRWIIPGYYGDEELLQFEVG